MTQVLWSINSYDRQGDLIENGIYIHIGNVSILVANTVDEFQIFREQMEETLHQIGGNLSNIKSQLGV